MAEEQNVNENSPFGFIMQIINRLSDDEIQMLLEFAYEIIMNPLRAIFMDMEDEDIPVDEPEPAQPAAVMEEEVPPVDQDPPQLFRIFVTKNYNYQDVIIVEIINPLYDPNDPYIFME